MTNNKGFTLMEILLAAFIVGIIGVALAALTTAAVRETGVARTRTMLRHQLSVALRQLRQDIEQADSVEISFGAAGSGLPTTSSMTLDSNAHPLGPHQHESQRITYSFNNGTIKRTVWKIDDNNEVIGDHPTSNRVWLENVKNIRTDHFSSPRFAQETLGASTEQDRNNVASAIRVTLIVEVNGSPVVNETVDEIFMLPHGFPINTGSN